MKNKLLLVLFLGFITGITAQEVDNSMNQQSKLTWSAYGEVVYNQPESSNGFLDVKRLVVLMGYSFSEKVSLITELEYEHVKEVYVEQFYLDYKLTDNFNVKGGLMLVPMGIINEYHEPNFFNGVERPAVDNSIVPTTWREIGVGVSGKFDDLALGYQAYVFNGFKSYDEPKDILVVAAV